MQAVTGCPILKLDYYQNNSNINTSMYVSHSSNNKWNKVKNIRKHPNIYGFALSSID